MHFSLVLLVIKIFLIPDFFIDKTENNKTSLKVTLKYYEGDPVIKEI